MTHELSAVLSQPQPFCEVFGPAQRIDQPHLLDRRTRCLQKPRRSNNDPKAPRPRDRHIQPVTGVEEFDLPRQVVAGRCSHRDQDNVGFLALELSTVPT